MKNLIIFDFLGTLASMRPPKLLINKSVLEANKRQSYLAIISGGPKTEINNILIKLGINDLFDLVITKDDTNLRKPNPKLIELVREKFLVKKTIYVGDTLKDFKMASNANISFIFIGKRKIGDSQLNYNYQLVEEAIDKLLI